MALYRIGSIGNSGGGGGIGKLNMKTSGAGHAIGIDARPITQVVTLPYKVSHFKVTKRTISNLNGASITVTINSQNLPNVNEEIDVEPTDTITLYFSATYNHTLYVILDIEVEYS